MVNVIKLVTYPILVKGKATLDIKQNIQGTPFYTFNLNLFLRALQNILANAVQYANPKNPLISF